MTPRVSVIVPTRDRLPQLQRALAGVAAQSLRDFEVIVVDDASADGTREWLASGSMASHVVTTTASAGAGAARNRGIERARGDLIAFLDDDDVWQPAYLEQQVRYLDANRDAALSYADHLEVDASGRTSRPDTNALLPYSSPLVRMLAEAFVHTMSVVVCRRELFGSLGPFDERLRVVQDLEWYARLLSSGRRLVRLPQTLVARAMPGGLVTQHRQWFDEEHQVREAAFAAGVPDPGDRQLVRAYRALFFSHLGFTRGDFPFALSCLASALTTSPRWTLHVAARRILRRLRHHERAARWDTVPAIS